MKLHSCRPRSKGFGCLDLQQARFRTFSHVCRVRFGQGVDQVLPWIGIAIKKMDRAW